MHRAGDTWRILIAKTAGIRPAVLDIRDVDAHETERLDDWFDEHHVGQVLVVLPASAVVCRTCTLPDTDPEQLALALDLQAEAAFRRSLAVPIQLSWMPTIMLF